MIMPTSYFAWKKFHELTQENGNDPSVVNMLLYLSCCGYSKCWHAIYYDIYPTLPCVVYV